MQLSTRPGRVAVFGATGHTGRFVVLELQRRGLMPIAVARNRAALEACEFASRKIEVVHAALEDQGALERAFAGADLVINCAGPFLDSADPVVAAALNAGSHYLDVTAEQSSALATLEKFDRRARDAGVLVLPAMGFYGGFADLLLTAAMADWDWAHEVEIGIALDSWHPTRGTRITGQRNTAPRKAIVNGRLEPLSQPAALAWEFPQPVARQDMIELPFSETVLIARHLNIVRSHTYLSMVALRDIRDPATPPPTAIDASGRSAQSFMVQVIAHQNDSVRQATASGRDIYAFTAPLLCEAVQRILSGAVQARGAQAPGAIFDAQDFLRALTPEYLTLDMASR